MNFEKDHIYHIYNQGNNKQKIFFEKENYHFFIRKIKTHVLPFADILAWCLMPNHFHLMVYIGSEGATIDSEGATSSRALTKDLSRALTPSRALTGKYETLNKSIGVMLTSYTRAINNQENFTGSLFRKKTKAICLTNPPGITPAFFNTTYGTLINIPVNAEEYPQICFDYIHNNPVKAGLVGNPAEWEFSSFREFFGDEILVNKTRVMQLELKCLPAIDSQAQFNKPLFLFQTHY